MAKPNPSYKGKGKRVPGASVGKASKKNTQTRKPKPSKGPKSGSMPPKAMAGRHQRMHKRGKGMM